MRRTCGWCGRPLNPSEAEPLNDPRETTGICSECEAKQTRRLYADMTDEQLDFAMSAVLKGGNQDAKLAAMNEYKRRKSKS